MKISTDAVFSPCRLAELNHVLSDWWQMQCLRHELESLDDSVLRDIGLNPWTAALGSFKARLDELA